jgi:hypothetical protein
MAAGRQVARSTDSSDHGPGPLSVRRRHHDRGYGGRRPVRGLTTRPRAASRGSVQVPGPSRDRGDLKPRKLTATECPPGPGGGRCGPSKLMPVLSGGGNASRSVWPLASRAVSMSTVLLIRLLPMVNIRVVAHEIRCIRTRVADIVGQ